MEHNAFSSCNANVSLNVIVDNAQTLGEFTIIYSTISSLRVNTSNKDMDSSLAHFKHLSKTTCTSDSSSKTFTRSIREHIYLEDCKYYVPLFASYLLKGDLF